MLNAALLSEFYRDMIRVWDSFTFSSVRYPISWLAYSGILISHHLFRLNAMAEFTCWLLCSLPGWWDHSSLTSSQHVHVTDLHIYSLNLKIKLINTVSSWRLKQMQKGESQSCSGYFPRSDGHLLHSPLPKERNLSSLSVFLTQLCLLTCFTCSSGLLKEGRRELHPPDRVTVLNHQCMWPH